MLTTVAADAQKGRIFFWGGKRKTYFEEWRESRIVVGLCDGNGESEGAGAVKCEHEEAEIETHLFF